VKHAPSQQADANFRSEGELVCQQELSRRGMSLNAGVWCRDAGNASTVNVVGVSASGVLAS